MRRIADQRRAERSFMALQMNLRILNILFVAMLGGLGAGTGCSGEGGTAAQGASGGRGQGGSGDGGSGGAAGAGGAGSSGKVEAGFGNTGNANYTHETFDSTSVNATWNASGFATFTALGPVATGNCRTSLSMVLGGAPKPGKEYVLDAVAEPPPDGTGYTTLAESCIDTGTSKLWRSTGGRLVVDEVTGDLVSFIFGDKGVVSLSSDMTTNSNDATGSMIMSGNGDVEFPGIP